MGEQFAIFHDWYDPARHDKAPACQTGEFFYVGAMGECAQEMERLSRLHPEWRLSIHELPSTNAA
jgi:hypothetical protein